MKEELLRVLNNKLDNVKVNIESLVELNKKIDAENDKLSYINDILNIFKKDNSYNILNFSQLSKEKFNKVVDILGGNMKDMFGASSCNYDGLVYLINGINNGISLSLTLEQENAINFFIQGLEGKNEEYEAVIDGLLLVKNHFEISDLDVLKEKQDRYEMIVDKLTRTDYVDETDEVLEAITFSKMEKEKEKDLLVYLLKYNASVYEQKKTELKVPENVIEPEKISEEKEVKEEEEIENQEFEVPVVDTPSIEFESQPENKEDKIEYEEFHLPEFEKIDTNNEVKEENNTIINDDSLDNMFVPLEVSTENEKVDPLPVIDPLPMVEELDKPLDTIPKFDLNNNVNENNDFEGLINKDDYEEYNVNDNSLNAKEELEGSATDENLSTRELQRLFKEYDINNFDNNLNELLNGNINNYREILSFMKNNDLLSEFRKNEDLFLSVLKNSTAEDLDDVLKIIKNELSVDAEDYNMTLKIAINTLPTIFVREDGNYENFVRNVKMFKEMGINLISLFDFSKEIFVAEHNNLLKNYSIVKKYNFDLNYKNLKYMLMLSDIGERIDYYVESVYPDRTKDNELFDGLTYINNYPSKLNSIEPETIKRLRYSSENSKKVFGSKPGSLAGEIVNLKVNVLDITPDYMNSFFDNKFDVLTADEVREYAKLCQNSSNIGDFTNELSFLEIYHNGLRYVIEGINISYNKVIRNYNTLRSYSIDTNKALLFAVCYNLIITNEEYMKIKKTLERDGE